MQDPIVIVAAKRTPLGCFNGVFKKISAPQLGATAIKAALEQAQLNVDDIDNVLMGCVLSAGLGQAPARQAAITAGLLPQTPCATINKVCGSGMQTVMFAHDALCARDEIYVAGGMESMTRAPYLLSKARFGYRLGDGCLQDHMYLDGLQNAYDENELMGCFADKCASKFKVSREDQDKFAIKSLTRANNAIKNKYFNDEISPVTLPSSSSETISEDEGPSKFKAEKIPTLKPIFNPQGSVTAANSSAIADGAAALVLMRRSRAQALGIKPLATIVGHAVHAQEPEWFTTAPIGAIDKLLKNVGWHLDEVDLFEINEAFAVVSLVAMNELKLPSEKVNVHGGACALGHPLGATGARILVTLLYALKQQQKQRGVAALCIGGGEATAIAIELEA